MGVKLRSAADSQIIYGNAEKQFFTRKHNRQTLGKVISISENALIQFDKIVWAQLGN